MPYSLKGVDLVVFNVFTSLGLGVKIRPLLDSFELDEMDQTDYEIARDCYDYCPGDFPEYLPNQGRGCPCGRSSFCGGGCSPHYPDFPSFKEWKAQKPQGDMVGTEFRELTFRQTGVDATYVRDEKESVRTIPALKVLSLTPDARRSCRLRGRGRNTEI